MKQLFFYTLLTFLAISMITCTSKDDGREWKNVTIINAYIDGKIQSGVNVTDEKTTFKLPAGTALDKLKLKLVVINGEAVDFPENVEYDFRKPVDVKLKSFGGGERIQKLHIVAPPKLTDFFIEEVSIDPEKIYFTNNKLIVQVPSGTDITNLKVTMNFLNGTSDFQNGTAKNFTEKQIFTITGVDETTTYPYDFLITTNEVGPAAITSIKINGNEVESKSYTTADMDGNSMVTYYASKIDNFADATIDLEVGFGNELDGFTNGTKLDLFTQPVIKIVGTNGITTHFKFTLPKIKTELTSVSGSTTQSLGAVFSGTKVVAAGGAINSLRVFNALTGGTSEEKMLASGGFTIPTGIMRKIASDVDGKILGISMSHTTTNFKVYKWDNVDATPTEYLEYIDATVANVRTAGIRIKGSLAGNAIIYVTLVGNTALKFTVSGGVLNATPEKLNYTIGFSNFAAVEEIAGNTTQTIISTIKGTTNNFISINGTDLTEIVKKQVSGGVSNSKTIVHKGRTFLAYVAINEQGGNLNTYKICDITEMDSKSLDKEIFVYKTTATSALGNGTTDVDFTIMNEKLYVLFTAENALVSVFCLE